MLEQNCEPNSKIIGDFLFSLEVGQFVFGKLKAGVCENGLLFKMAFFHLGFFFVCFVGWFFFLFVFVWKVVGVFLGFLKKIQK